MNRYPNKYSQHSYQNQYRLRPNSGASLARFINNSRFSTPFSGRGHHASALYQSSATVSPNTFQPPRIQGGQFRLQNQTAKMTERVESSHPEQISSEHDDNRQTEATATAGQVLNANTNTNRGNKLDASILSKQFENADKQNENISTNLKMADPPERSEVMSDFEGKAKSTADTDIKKAEREGDANDDDDESDEDTSYCRYCKRSFSSSVAYHSHTRGMVHMNLYMEAQAAKAKKETSAAPEITEGNKNQGLLIQPGQIDSFLKEKWQKKLEKQQNRISKNKDSVLNTENSQSDDKNCEKSCDGLLKAGHFEAGNISYFDNMGPNDSGRFEEAENYGNRIGQFYNYENSESVQRNLFENTSYNTSICSYRTQSDTEGQFRQNNSYVEYGYGDKTNPRETGEHQFQDYHDAHSSSAEPSQTYRSNEYGFKQQFDKASFNKPQESHEVISSQTEEVEEEEEEDTSFCKYCQLPFKSAMAYHAHTRGLQHTTLIMEAKEKKGDQRFRKEKVDPDVLKVEIPEPIIEKPKVDEADVPEDYDFETNWMNLDDELIKRLKSRTKAAERDLNPDEIGKKQFIDDFSCAVCNMKCTSAVTFKMHVDGKTHKANMEHLESGNKFKLKQKKSGNTVFATVDGEDVQSQFSQVIGNYKENALLGLEFITEFQKPDPKAACRYVCNLCEAKCDSSTILPHVIGVKHKLHYLRETHYDIYEHLTKYTSRKKKSEMNVNAEDFAKQIEEKEGRKDVKVKIELDAGSADNDLTEIMTRMSKALKEKLQEFEKKEDNDNTKESQDLTEPRKEPTGLFKAGSMTTSKGENKRETNGTKGSRFKLSDYAGSMSHEPGNHGHFMRPPPHMDMWQPIGPPRHWSATPSNEHPGFLFRDGNDYFGSTRYYGANRNYYPRQPPYSRDRDPRNWDPRNTLKGSFIDDPPYDGGRPSGDFFEYEEESRRLDKMLDYRLSDPYDEGRRLDDLYYRQQHLREQETRRLDDLLLDRHKLSDPTRETRRLENIMERKKQLAEMEKTRLDDIMRRKKILDEHDPEKLRLERYEKLRKTTISNDETASKETERPSMEELIARRKANNAAVTQENRPLADHSLLPSSYSGSSATISSQPQPAALASTPVSSSQSQGSQAAFNTAQQVVANKELQEELARNPGVNIGELLGNLSSSMIATEDDAAMALQVSNALTQALLRFRLQHATKQLSKPGSTKPAETKTIPGLGCTSGTESDKSVPSFLRTTTGSTSKLLSDQLHNDLSLPQVSKKRTSSGRSERQKDSKKTKTSLSESSPQTDLLKSIREQAAQLQARISSKVTTSTTASQHEIQASSQFVHDPTPHGIQTVASFSSTVSQCSGTSSTSQYSNVGSFDHSQSLISSSESAVSHVNPSFYANWFKTMYDKDMPTTVTLPGQSFQPVAVPPLPQPSTSAKWYNTMYGNLPTSAPQAECTSAPATPLQSNDSSKKKKLSKC